MPNYNALSGDGFVRNFGTSSWATLRGAGSGTSANSSANTFQVYADSISDFTNRYIDRAFVPFDTAAIGAGPTITAASVWLYIPPTSTSDADGGSVAIVAGTQASTSTLATSDFSAVGTTEFCSRVTFTTLVAAQGGWKEFPLNASGIAAINTTGATKFAIRSSFDLDNSEPGSFYYSVAQFYSSDYSDSTKRPYLAVTGTGFPTPGAPPFRRRPSGLYVR